MKTLGQIAFETYCGWLKMKARWTSLTPNLQDAWEVTAGVIAVESDKRRQATHETR